MAFQTFPQNNADYFSSTRRHNDDAASALRRAEALAHLMDAKFRIPGTRRTIGIDGMLGLVPGIGDAISAALSTYIIGEAWRLNVPKHVIARMGWNVAVDTMIGAIPLAGDLFDFAWKANGKNATLLAKHLATSTSKQFAH